MKKLVVLVLVLLAVWLGVNYYRTGTLSLLPGPSGAADRELQALEAELGRVNAQIAAAGRAAGMTGADTTADVAALETRRQDLEKKIAALRQGR